MYPLAPKYMVTPMGRIGKPGDTMKLTARRKRQLAAENGSQPVPVVYEQRSAIL